MTEENQNPAIYNYEMVQGDAFEKIYTFTTPDLTGATFEAKILDAKGNVLKSFTIVHGTGVDIQKVTLSLTSADTKCLPLDCNWYFKILTSGSMTNRTIWAGDFTVKPKQNYE